MSKHLMTVERKNSLLAGRNLQQSQAEGVAAICHNRLRVRGGR